MRAGVGYLARHGTLSAVPNPAVDQTSDLLLKRHRGPSSAVFCPTVSLHPAPAPERAERKKGGELKQSVIKAVS